MPAANPTSGAALADAGLLNADAVLIAAEEGLRSSPAEADAAVLSCLVSIQHLLASQGVSRALSHSRSLAGKSSASGSAQGAGAQGLGLIGSGASSIFNSVTKGAVSVTKGAANLTFKAAATAVSAAKTLAVLPREDSSAGGQGLGGAGRAKPKVPHVVACVSTTSSKAVAAAFFGPPAAGQAAGGGGAAAAAASRAVAGMDVVKGGVVGSRLFTYELLVPGEIEGSVLVQVANEPLYVKVSRGRGAWFEGRVCVAGGPNGMGWSGLLLRLLACLHAWEPAVSKSIAPPHYTSDSTRGSVHLLPWEDTQAPSLSHTGARTHTLAVPIHLRTLLPSAGGP